MTGTQPNLNPIYTGLVTCIVCGVWNFKVQGTTHSLFDTAIRGGQCHAPVLLL